jgi:hypothetical protein
MIKKSILAFIMILLITVSAALADETGDQGERPKFGFNMNFAIGLSSYEDIDGNQVAYQKFGIFPEFTYGKWGLGLDLTVELDGDFKLRDLDKDGRPDRWSTFWDYVTRIYYLRYGYKGDPLYGRIGAFSYYTLGHGMIMDGYSNTLFYPQIIQLGLNFDMDGELFDFPYIGIETVVDDVLDWDVIGLRVYSRPLSSLSTPIIKDLKVGGTIVTDRDPQENPAKRFERPVDNPHSDPVTEFGLDVELPLLQKQDLSIIAYTDWAMISGKGSGAWVGSTLTYKWASLLAQLRFFGKEFVPQYFDGLYELDRSTKYNSLNAYDSFYIGYLIGTELLFFNIVDFYFFWSDAFGDPDGPGIETGIGLAEGALPKLEAGFMYEKQDIDSFADFFNSRDTLMQFIVGYQVSGAVKIVFIYERSYTPYTGTPTGRTMVETQISF